MSPLITSVGSLKTILSPAVVTVTPAEQGAAEADPAGKGRRRRSEFGRDLHEAQLARAPMPPATSRSARVMAGRATGVTAELITKLEPAALMVGLSLAGFSSMML